MSLDQLSRRAPVLRFLVCPVAAFACSSSAHAQTNVWISQFGTSANDFIHAMASDGQGGVFATGYTEGALGPAQFGSGDAFLTRCDAQGDPVWTRQLGTFYQEIAFTIAPDLSGGVIIAGETWGDLAIPKIGGFDFWIARYDASGARLWIKQAGSTDYDTARACAPDGTGGVFVGGWTDGINMGGGPAVGGRDAWLARYDADGNPLFIRQFGTTKGDLLFGAAEDGLGGVYVCGETGGAFTGTNAGLSDIWLQHYDSTGTPTWVVQFGTGGIDAAKFAVADGVGGVYIGGEAADLSGSEIWVARYDSNGNRLWLRQFGAGSNSYAQAGAPDGAGGVLVSGYTYGVIAGTSAGLNDAWVAHYDADGNQSFITQFGSAENDWAIGVASDGTGGAIVGGGTMGDLGGVSLGDQDAFLARFADTCYADCDTSTGVGVLDVFDFLCFQNSFVNSEPFACDCDTSTGPGVCDIFDFLCFQDAFVGGCP